MLHRHKLIQLHRAPGLRFFFHELNGGENVLCYILKKKKKEQVWDPGDSVTQDNMILQIVKIAEAICSTKCSLLPMLICAGSNSAEYIDKILSYIKIVWENCYKYAFSIASSVFQLSLLVFVLV